jgi:hypothetical protein
MSRVSGESKGKLVLLPRWRNEDAHRALLRLPRYRSALPDGTRTALDPNEIHQLPRRLPAPRWSRE